MRELIYLVIVLQEYRCAPIQDTIAIIRNVVIYSHTICSKCNKDTFIIFDRSFNSFN